MLSTVLSQEELLHQLKRVLSQPHQKIDYLEFFSISAQFAAAGLQLPLPLPALEIPRKDLVSAVRSLITGQTEQPGALGVIGLDPVRTEARCSRVEVLRAGLTTALGVAQTLRTELSAEEEKLQDAGKRSYGRVRPLVGEFATVATTLAPATEHFYGPAQRAAKTRVLTQKAANRAVAKERARRESGPAPAPVVEEVPSHAPVATLAGRRSTRRD